MTSVRLPTFNGDEDNFQKWWTRFNAYARVKRFEKALRTDLDLPVSQAKADLLDKNNAQEKVQMIAARRNDITVAQLTMAMETDGLLGKVEACKTTLSPN